MKIKKSISIYLSKEEYSFLKRHLGYNKIITSQIPITIDDKKDLLELIDLIGRARYKSGVTKPTIEKLNEIKDKLENTDLFF